MNHQKQLKQINSTREELADAVRAACSDIAAVRGREELTVTARGSAVEARRKELREAVEAIEERGKSALAELRAAAPRRKTVDPAEGSRLWRRYERRLEAGESPVSLAQALVAEGNQQGLHVLAEELPDHLRATGATPELFKAELEALRSVEQPLLSDAEAQHRDAVASAERGAEMLKINAGFVRKDAETTEQIFGDDPGDTIDLRPAA